MSFIQYQLKAAKATAFRFFCIAFAAFATIVFVLGRDATSAMTWSLPWPAGIQAGLTQGWHYDGYLQAYTALDLGLSGGTPVLVPVDSTVIRSCDAGGNHRAIYLQAADGQKYTLIHVFTTSVRATYKKGDTIGTVATNYPNNTACARWASPNAVHLHMGLPSQTFVLDNYQFSPSSIPSPLISRNAPAENDPAQDIDGILTPIFHLLSN